MRALSLRGPRAPELVEVPDPVPGDGEVLLRIRGCGVCGSDLNAWRGVSGIAYPLPAGAPGHEAWGEVISPPMSHVAGIEPGQRVTGVMANGFAELAVAPAENVVALPESFSGGLLGEPLACAMNVVRRACLTSGTSLAIVGFGYLAALMIHLLPDGIQNWIAISRRQDSRDLAQGLGAAATYDFGEVPSNLWDSVDVVIEAAGVQQTLDFATWLTAYRGRLVIAGYHADGPRTVNMQSWNWKGLDVINAHERQPATYVDALRQALTILGERGTDPSVLNTHVLPLEQAGEAFTLAESRPQGFFKAVVCP